MSTALRWRTHSAWTKIVTSRITRLNSVDQSELLELAQISCNSVPMSGPIFYIGPDNNKRRKPKVQTLHLAGLERSTAFPSYENKSHYLNSKGHIYLSITITRIADHNTGSHGNSVILHSISVGFVITSFLAAKAAQERTMSFRGLVG